MKSKAEDALRGKNLLVVSTGSLKKNFILKRMKELGLTIIALEKETNWARKYVDHWILADTSNSSECIQAIKDFQKEEKKKKKGITLDGVVTFWEDSVLLTSKLVDEFKFIGIPNNIANKVRNKVNFREFCKNNQLPAPNYLIIKDEKDLVKVHRKLKFPLVLKPIFGASSAFVIKVENLEQLKNTYQYLNKNISTQTESALTNGTGIYAEEYIDGDEVDIDIIVQNGKMKYFSITDNFQTNEPFFVETGSAVPSTLPAPAQKQLVNLAEETLEKLGIMNGCIHFEAKSTAKGAVPIEVNLRMGGDEVFAFSREAWGFDLIEHAVKVALGVHFRFEKPEEPKSYLMQDAFLSKSSGIMVETEINPKIKKLKFLSEFHFYKKSGDVILAPPEGYDPIGWLIVRGDNLNDAEDNLDEAKSMVRYKIIKFDPASSLGRTERSNRFSVAGLKKEVLKATAKLEQIKKISRQDLRKLNIGIACNVYDKKSREVEYEITKVGRTVEKTLKNRGYQVKFFDLNNVNKFLNDISKSKIDVIFNLAERVNNSSLLEPHTAALFDILQIPYTGSNPMTLALAIDKIKVKKLLDYHDIPTPKWDYVYSLDDPVEQELDYPLIVKPANSDNSIGITNNSVVTNEKELKVQIKKTIQELQSPALIEEYISGDEYDVSILGNDENAKVLPLSKSVFTKLPKNLWHIYPYESKWNPDSIYSKKVSVERPPKKAEKSLHALITEIALDTYNVLDCHDYGRVEIKVDENSNPHVLELNPNPSINKGNCLPAVAELAGMDYGDFLEEIIYSAIQRYQDKPSYSHLASNIL